MDYLTEQLRDRQNLERSLRRVNRTLKKQDAEMEYLRDREEIEEEELIDLYWREACLTDKIRAAQADIDAQEVD